MAETLRELLRGRHPAGTLIRALTNLLPGAIAYVDADERLLLANRAYSERIGSSVAGLEGRSLAEVMGPIAYARLRPLLLKALAGESSTFEGVLAIPATGGGLVRVACTPDATRGGGVDGVVLFLLDVDDREGADQALRQQVLLRDFVENATEGLHWVGPDGIILWANKAELDLLGYTREEYVGHNIADFHADPAVIADILARLTARERLYGYEARMRARDGSIKDVLVNSSVYEEDGRFVHTRCFTRDITDRKRAETENAELLRRERAAREDAERANRLKDEFLTTLSHELRTPLNAIVGWVHALRTGVDQPTLLRATEVIHRNAMIQAQLIADILDLQRLTVGKLRLSLRELDVASAVQAAVDTILPAAAAKQIDLKVVVDTQIGPFLGDPDRLQQIVWNLLSNGLKFTPKGGCVTARVVQTTSNVEIEVEDNGPGIDPQFLPYIFERFRQGDSSSTRRHGGLGVGLSIVRSLVELHGGTVTAANRSVGGGAIFTVRLPRRSASPVRSVAGSVERRGATVEKEVWLDAAPSLHGIKVLVIDDEPDAREITAMVLGKCGADVSVAATAAEGFAVLLREHPHVVLCDVEMPDEDGYSFLRRVRELPREEGGATPAAALTAYAGAEDRVKALQAGFRMHVPKPVQPAELATIVASLVDRGS